MDSQATRLLENILERLTKVEAQQETQLKKQSQIDQVIERLDTIQNCLERQNHKQNLLHDKLSAVSMSTQIVEEKVFTKDKLLSDLSTKLEQEKGFFQDQFSSIFTQLEQEKVFMRDQLSTISNQLDQEKVFMRDQLKEAQDEILHRLSELQQQNVSTRSQAVSVGEVSMEKVVDHLATVTEELKKYTTSVCQKLKEELMASHKDTIYNSQEKIESTIEQSAQKVVGHLVPVKQEILKTTDSALQELKEILKDAKVESRVDESTKNVLDYLSKVKEELIKTNANSCEQLRKKVFQSNKDTFKSSQEKTETAVQEATKELNKGLKQVYTDLDKTKRDLVAFIEGRGQIVRDRIAGPLPQHKKYVCDFYIENFRQLVRSGKKVTSLPWHINQFDSSVCGYANLLTSGKMKVRLVYGRHPRQLGLQSRSGVTLKYKATITDTSGQLPDLVVGEATSTWTEEGIKNNKHWGWSLVEMSCDELIQKGYGDKEVYLNDALLVRYEIEVV